MIRKTDVFAGAAWLFAVLFAAAEDVTRRREPWLLMAIGVACTLTMMAFASRKFERLEREEFERGMDAALHGLVDIRDARYRD